MKIKNREGFINELILTMCLVLVAVSGIANFGWVRIVYFLPMLLHAAVFFFANRFSCKYVKVSKFRKLMNGSVCVTYLLCYFLIPDGGDTPDSIRVFFGLISNEDVVNMAGGIASNLIIINIFLILFQLVYTGIVKCKRKNTADL